MNDKTKKTLEDVMAAETKAVLAADISDIYSNLVEGVDNAKLPEPLFIEHFLPVLLGTINTTDHPEVVENWGKVAGSPHNDFDVINQDGETLFTVPALYSTEVLDVINRRLGVSYSEIYDKYELHRKSFPIPADRALLETLGEKANHATKSQDESESLSRLSKIFARYSPPAKAASVNNDPDADLDV